MVPAKFISLLSRFDPNINIQHIQVAQNCLVANLSTPTLARSWMNKSFPELSRGQGKIEEDVFRLADRIEEFGISHTYPGQNDFLQKFWRINPLPLCLFYLGQLGGGQLPVLSVVGSREIEDDIKLWMNWHLGQVLQKSKTLIVSGGARGVDQTAHAVALRNQSPTAVFLPSGLNRCYPSEIKYWQNAIVAAGGCLVSEFGPDIPMRKYHFSHRNRLIAGMADVLFVVQAARSSGSMVTAMHALEMGITICVLPHFPNRGCVMGTVDLVRDGAIIIRDAEDLLVAMHQLGPISVEAPNCDTRK